MTSKAQTARCCVAKKMEQNAEIKIGALAMIWRKLEKRSLATDGFTESAEVTNFHERIGCRLERTIHCLAGPLEDARLVLQH